MYDVAIGAMSAAVSSHSALSARLFPGASPGDVVFSPTTFEHECVRVSSAGGVAFSGLVAPALFIDGQDVAGLLEKAGTDRLRAGELRDANFATEGFGGAKLSGPLPAYLGGTGVAASPAMSGLVITGDGTGSDALRFDAGLRWSEDLSVLDVSREAAIGGESARLLLDASGRPTLACKDAPTVDLSDYALGVPPVASIREPRPGFSDSNVEVEYEASGDVRAVFLSVYGAGAEPHFESEIASGTGAIFSERLSVGQGSGTRLVEGLSPMTKYVVMCTATDGRGNLSAARALDVRTTGLGAPVASVGSVTTSPTRVSFVASSAPKASPMLFAAGLLTSRTPPLAAQDVESRISLFHSESIPENVARAIAVSFSRAHDPARSFAPEPVREGATYHPFAYYRDAEGNSSIQYATPAYNPDVTAPAFYLSPIAKSFTETEMRVECGIADSVGVVRARAFAALLPSPQPSAADVMSRGQALPVFAGSTSYYLAQTNTAVTDGVGPANSGVQSAVLSDAAESVFVTVVFELPPAATGFQIGFKSFGSPSADGSSAGEYSSLRPSPTEFAPTGSGTSSLPPSGAFVKATMRYVRSEKKVYFRAENLGTTAVFVSGTANSPTWYPGATVANIRAFGAPVFIYSFMVDTSAIAAVTEYHSSGSALPLEHTAKYRIYVAAEDAAGNVGPVSSVDARTKDSTPPRVTSLSATVAPGTSNVTVNATAADDGPAASITAIHLFCTSISGSYAPEQVLSNATARFDNSTSATATFSNVPAYLPTRVYAVCTDNAAEFGAPFNLLSLVASAEVAVPQVTGASFEQIAGRNISVTGGLLSRPTRVGLFVFKSPDAQRDDASMSNLLFISNHGSFQTLP